MSKISIVNVIGLGLLIAAGPACSKEPEAKPAQIEQEPEPKQKSGASSAEVTALGMFEHRHVAKSTLANTPPKCPPLEPDTVYRFVEGSDACMVVLTSAELARLEDPFAVNVLRADQFPDDVDAIVTAMTKSSWQPVSYVVGEGGQIPVTTAPREAPRNLRYVITWGPSENDARVFLSAAPGGNSSFLQVIAWDDKANRFNFYEWRAQLGGGPSRTWSLAGDSSLATQPATRGLGCFDCHHNGVTIMKELERPWNNWHSQLAQISSTNVPEAVAQSRPPPRPAGRAST